MSIAVPLLLRQRLPADDSFIADLAERAFSEYDLRSGVNTARMARSGATYIACRAETRLGFAIVLRPTKGSAELSAIAVEERARGTGVGTALLSFVERALAAEGVEELRLHTAEANLAAMDLFLKCGFAVQQRLPRFYRGVFGACSLHKRLVHSAR